MKPFNVHFNKAVPGKLQSIWKRRGWSALVTHSQQINCVDVYFSFCSKKDEFNKKKGLSIARTNPFVTVPKVQLPVFLHDLERECFKDGEPLHPKGHYNYLYKNFI